jgi:hypothetical protein
VVCGTITLEINVHNSFNSCGMSDCGVGIDIFIASSGYVDCNFCNSVSIVFFNHHVFFAHVINPPLIFSTYLLVIFLLACTQSLFQLSASLRIHGMVMLLI